MVIGYFILGLALLVAVVLLGRWFTLADPKRIAQVARWVLVAVGIVFGAYLLWGGRQALVSLAAVAGAFLLRRWLAGRLGGIGGWTRANPTPGGSSNVETPYLRMELDHDSGIFDGDVLAGRFAGQRLAGLSRDDLLALREDCRADADSLRILEAYLDRRLGPDWREAGEGMAGASGAGAASGAMSREEAYAVLGLEPGATPEAIRNAHRRMMQKLHPDHGGSNYLAAKINQAKELLLG